MNKKIMKQAGLGDMVKDVENGLCPFCKHKIQYGEFRDALSWKEYKISGLCQLCQDEIFKEVEV